MEVVKGLKHALKPVRRVGCPAVGLGPPTILGASHAEQRFGGPADVDMQRACAPGVCRTQYSRSGRPIAHMRAHTRLGCGSTVLVSHPHIKLNPYSHGLWPGPHVR